MTVGWALLLEAGVVELGEALGCNGRFRGSRGLGPDADVDFHGAIVEVDGFVIGVGLDAPAVGNLNGEEAVWTGVGSLGGCGDG